MNPQIFRWFDDGHIPEALLGRGSYFLRDYTWGDHNVLLVLRQLFEWADSAEQLVVAGEGLMDALRTTTADCDPVTVHHILWCYYLARESESHEFPLSRDEILELLDRVDDCPDPTPEEVATHIEPLSAKRADVRAVVTTNELPRDSLFKFD